MHNYDTTGHILWPYDGEPEYCDLCGKRTDYELTEIDGDRVCDRCASDLIHARNGDN